MTYTGEYLPSGKELDGAHLRNTHPVERYWEETWLKDIRGTPTQLILGRGGEAGLKIPREYPSRGMALSGAWFNDIRGIPTQWKGIVEKGKFWIEAKSEFYP